MKSPIEQQAGLLREARDVLEDVGRYLGGQSVSRAALWGGGKARETPLERRVRVALRQLDDYLWDKREAHL